MPAPPGLPLPRGAALGGGLPPIGQRLVRGEDADFAAPTGPSVQGGDRIAAAIAPFAMRHGGAAMPSTACLGEPR